MNNYARKSIINFSYEIIGTIEGYQKLKNNYNIYNQ